MKEEQSWSYYEFSLLIIICIVFPNINISKSLELSFFLFHPGIDHKLGNLKTKF